MEQNELQERIVNYMRTAAYKPLTADDLAAAMNLAQEEIALFWTALEELEKTAAVIKTRHERFGVPERMNLVVGRLSMSAKGFGARAKARSSASSSVPTSRLSARSRRAVTSAS